METTIQNSQVIQYITEMLFEQQIKDIIDLSKHAKLKSEIQAALL